MESRTDLIALIRRHRALLEAEGVTELYLFGSQARGSSDAYSDVDVAVKYNSGFNLLNKIGVRQLLEDELDTSVDVVTFDTLLNMDEGPAGELVRVF